MFFGPPSPPPGFRSGWVYLLSEKEIPSFLKRFFFVYPIMLKILQLGRYLNYIACNLLEAASGSGPDPEGRRP